MRCPTEVVAELDEHDVVLRRRNAPALRLCRADRDIASAGALNGFASLLRNLAARNPEALGEALCAAYPWVKHSPIDERATLADELAEEISAAVSAGSSAQVMQCLREWQSTAEVYADPRVAARAVRAVRGDSRRTRSLSKRLIPPGRVHCLGVASVLRLRRDREAGIFASATTMPRRAGIRFAPPRRPTPGRRGFKSPVTLANATNPSTRSGARVGGLSSTVSNWISGSTRSLRAVASGTASMMPTEPSGRPAPAPPTPRPPSERWVGATWGAGVRWLRAATLSDVPSSVAAPDVR